MKIAAAALLAAAFLAPPLRAEEPPVRAGAGGEGFGHLTLMDDVRLRFEGGEVVEATAARGQEFLEEMIGVDDGARRIGEFAFGLNDAVTAFTRNILFDEKIGGTVHLALGASYPESGGKVQSALHWDLVCDLRQESEVYADGEVVYRDGAFVDGIL